MWVMAKQDYVNIRSGQKVLTEGKQYQVLGVPKKDGYTVRNDNNKTGFYPKELFQIMEQGVGRLPTPCYNKHVIRNS